MKHYLLFNQIILINYDIRAIFEQFVMKIKMAQPASSAHLRKGLVSCRVRSEIYISLNYLL